MYWENEAFLEMDSEIHRLLEEVEIDRPPIKPKEIAKKLSITLHGKKEMERRGAYVRKGEAEFIFFRHDERKEREHFAIAREIIERYFMAKSQLLSHTPYQNLLSAQGAIMLLLPRIFFEPHAHQLNWNLFELKKIYRTASFEVIARRMIHFKPCLIHIYDNGKPTVATTIDGLRLDRTFKEAERSLFTSIMASGSYESIETQMDHSTQRINAKIEGWPIFEPDKETGKLWKRIIMIVHFSLLD